MSLATVTNLDEYRRLRLPAPGYVSLRVSIAALGAFDARERAQDSAGFLNAWEESFVANLAELAEERWTAKQRRAALRTVARHSERLVDAGYRPDWPLAKEIHGLIERGGA